MLFSIARRDTDYLLMLSISRPAIGQNEHRPQAFEISFINVLSYFSESYEIHFININNIIEKIPTQNAHHLTIKQGIVSEPSIMKIYEYYITKYTTPS